MLFRSISVGVHNTHTEFIAETTAFVWLGSRYQPVHFFVLPKKGMEKVILGMPFCYDTRLVFEYDYQQGQVMANLVFNRTRIYLRLGMGGMTDQPSN